MAPTGNHTANQRATVTRPTTLTVVVADDRPIVRAGLRVALEAVATVAADSDDDGLVGAVEANDPDVAVVGVGGTGPDPFRSVATATALAGELRVVALADAASMVDLREAVIAGVDSFLLTDTSPEDLAEAVRTTARGERVVSPSIAMRLATTWHDELTDESSSLTPRELEVLELLTEGLTNKQIGGRLNLSPRTIKTHVQNILRKLDVPDRTAAVARGLRSGLIR